MKGTLKTVDEEGQLWLKPGEYGKDSRGVWMCCPERHLTGDLSKHKVTEHEDGTITVSPSILLTDGEGGRSWHGYLERGVFRKV